MPPNVGVNGYSVNLIQDMVAYLAAYLAYGGIYVVILFATLVPILLFTYGISYFLKVMMGTTRGVRPASASEAHSSGQSFRSVNPRVVWASAACATGAIANAFVLSQVAVPSDLTRPIIWFAVWCGTFCFPLVLRHWGPHRDLATLLGRGVMLLLAALALTGWLGLYHLLGPP